jgi:hypothetical protein
MSSSGALFDDRVHISSVFSIEQVHDADGEPMVKSAETTSGLLW